MSSGPEKQFCKHMQGDFAAHHSHGDVGACNVTIVYTNPITADTHASNKPLSQCKVKFHGLALHVTAPRLNTGT